MANGFCVDANAQLSFDPYRPIANEKAIHILREGMPFGRVMYQVKVGWSRTPQFFSILMRCAHVG
jgi:hypothetical protein